MVTSRHLDLNELLEKNHYRLSIQSTETIEEQDTRLGIFETNRNL
jgi:hypothetical protein